MGEGTYVVWMTACLDYFESVAEVNKWLSFCGSESE